MQNIQQGLEACLVGLVVSILFMIFFYKKFGLIATSALVANLVLIIGIMSLLPGATLTMPGIAGIVLTLAVAVDANVLINERIKEELSNGRSVQQAIDEGYKGAFSSIFDANVTTLIKVLILYAVGTGAIKGFAITLRYRCRNVNVYRYCRHPCHREPAVRRQARQKAVYLRSALWHRNILLNN